MSDLAEVRDALTSRLSADMPTVYAYGFPSDVVSAPAFVLMPPTSVELREMLGNFGAKRYLIPIRLFVAWMSPPDAQLALDDLIDQACDSLHRDGTLASRVDSCLPLQADNFGLVDVGDVSYYACDLGVEVVI